MANISHSAITDPNIHEPKGVATATAGKVYTANGSGSGTWSLPYPPGISGASNGQVFVANGSGGGSWQGQAGATNKGYGEMYIQGNASATTIAASNTPVKIATGMTAGQLSGLTFSTDKLVVDEATKYRVDVSLTFFGVAATTIDWEFDIFAANASIGRKQRVQTTGTEHVVVSLSGITGTLAVSDQIYISVANKTDANDPTIVNLSCIVQEL